MNTRNRTIARRQLLALSAMLMIELGLAPQVARAELSERVVVVRNARSPISRAVADDYAQRRGVRNVLTISCQDAAAVAPTERVIAEAGKARRILDQAGYTVMPLALFSDLFAAAETMAFADYRRDIETPLRAFLASHPGIDFIVLTKGIPIRIKDVPTETGLMRYSLDSYLAALDYDTMPDSIRVDILDQAGLWFSPNGQPFRSQAWANRYWNSMEGFSHAKFGGYLVTRLDGYTEADAKALTTRSLEAERLARAGKTPEGDILLDVAPALGITDPTTGWNPLGEWNIVTPVTRAAGRKVRVITQEEDLEGFNGDLRLTAHNLKARNIPVELNWAERFVGNRDGLMGYASWGSNDPKFDALAYHSLRFAPGAIAETAVSTSARTFQPASGGQSLIADLVAQGISGVKGYTDEPMRQALASPRILFDRYVRGWTLAESFYAASSFVKWQDIVIGDPLLRAYPAAAAQ